MGNIHDLAQYNQRKREFTPELGRIYKIKSRYSRRESDLEWSATAKIIEIRCGDLYPYVGYVVMKSGISVHADSAISDMFPIPEERLEMAWNVSGVSRNGQKLYNSKHMVFQFSDMPTEKPLNVDNTFEYNVPLSARLLLFLLLALLMFSVSLLLSKAIPTLLTIIVIALSVFLFLKAYITLSLSSDVGGECVVDALTKTYSRKGLFRRRRFSFNCRYGWETVGGQQVVIDKVLGSGSDFPVFGRVITSPAVYDKGVLISEEISIQVKWDFGGFAYKNTEMLGSELDFYDLRNKSAPFFEYMFRHLRFSN